MTSIASLDVTTGPESKIYVSAINDTYCRSEGESRSRVDLSRG